jgi:hypothetical protein
MTFFLSQPQKKHLDRKKKRQLLTRSPHGLEHSNRWLLPHDPYSERVKTAVTHHVLSHYNTLPSVHIDAHPSQTFLTRYPANKTALYIEPRSNVKFLVPLLLHMMQVVPPDWRFVFMGSAETAQRVRDNYAANMYEAMGKLHVRSLEEGGWSAGWGRHGWDERGVLSMDEISNRLLTNLTFFDRELVGTEWLLVFHSDAILCANAEKSLDEWLGWDYVGAPWYVFFLLCSRLGGSGKVGFADEIVSRSNGERFGGNGGLSIRRLSKVREVLQFQSRFDDSVSEDHWMTSRLALLPGSHMCPPDKEKEFSVEQVWHPAPMGYHIDSSSLPEDVWKRVDRRRHIYNYCPEIKIILDMYLDREKCPDQVAQENEESSAYAQEVSDKDQEKKDAIENEKERFEDERRESERREMEEAEARRLQAEEIIEEAKRRLKAELLAEQRAKSLSEASSALASSVPEDEATETGATETASADGEAAATDISIPESFVEGDLIGTIGTTDTSSTVASLPTDSSGQTAHAEVMEAEFEAGLNDIPTVEDLPKEGDDF